MPIWRGWCERSVLSDFYFRISAFPLHVPPLRSRPEDIPVPAERLLLRLSAEFGCGAVGLEKDAEWALQRYCWPGNIRELRNVLERAALLSGSGENRRCGPACSVTKRLPRARALRDVARG